MANKLQSQIDKKLTETNKLNPKSQCQAGVARNEKYLLKRTQKAMYALAKAYEANDVPVVLTGIKTKKDVYELMDVLRESGDSVYYSVPIDDMGVPRIKTPEALALWVMIEGQTEDEFNSEDFILISNQK